jgi:hypothetical protein
VTSDVIAFRDRAKRGNQKILVTESVDLLNFHGRIEKPSVVFIPLLITDECPHPDA